MDPSVSREGVKEVGQVGVDDEDDEQQTNVEGDPTAL